MEANAVAAEGDTAEKSRLTEALIKVRIIHQSGSLRQLLASSNLPQQTVSLPISRQCCNGAGTVQMTPHDPLALISVDEA